MAYPNVNVNIIDKSVQSPTLPVGVAALAGVTERGPVGQAVFIRSIQEYRETFGELLPSTTSIFPTLVHRALNTGAQLYITRILHYTDANDPTTFTPVIATGDNGGVFPFSETIISVDDVADTISILGDFTDYIAAGDSHTVQKAGGGTASLTVDAGGATYASGVTTIDYVAIAPGDASPGDALTWSSTLVASLDYEAKNAGTWGNYLTVEIKRAASGLANALDIFVSFTGSSNPNVIPSDLNESYIDFPNAPTASDIAKANTALKYINLTTVTSTPIGVTPAKLLAGGTDDYASINNIDYIGSATGQTGIRAFDEKNGFVKIACPELANNQVDVELLNYAILRKDCLAILRTPTDLDGYTAIDYRKQQGVYAGGTAIDNWRAVMLYGGITITDPVGGSEIDIPWIADFIGLSATKDKNIGAWRCVSGFPEGRGLIPNVLDIVYNLETPSRLQERNDVANAGLYPIAKKTVGGVTNIYSWGTRSLQIANSSLKFFNVSELLIYLANNLKPICETELFNPNSVNTWKAIYRKVKVFMQPLVDQDAITYFRYEGDQDVDTVSQAQVNTQTDIQNGKYKFNLYFDPIEPIEEIEINAIVTSSGLDVATV